MTYVFISYSSQNRAYARQVAKKLRSEGFEVWIDNARLQASEDWWHSIVQALQSCNAVVVILTPESDASEYVQLEITLAKKFKKRLFPLWLDGSIDTTNWAIFARTQIKDVRGGKLPDDDFFDKLAEFVNRNKYITENTTKSVAKASAQTTVKPANTSLDDPEIAPIRDAGVVAYITSSDTFNLSEQPPSNPDFPESSQLTENQLPLPTSRWHVPFRIFIGSTLVIITISAILILVSQNRMTGQIAFTTDRDGNDEIYVMNADGTNQHNLTNNPTSETKPSWSPDGRKIAFTTNRDGNDEIYAMNADGTDQHNLTNNPALEDSSTWSPDGRKIAFTTDRDGNSEIYVMNADGTNQHNLTNNLGEDGASAWSPDGTRISFTTTRDGNAEIYVMNADGTNQHNLTNNTAGDYDQAWSPDGKQIIFSSTRDVNREIYMINADGTDPRRLTNTRANNSNVAWSPDGTQITFTTDRDGIAEIYVINADGTDPRRLTHNPTRDVFPVWHS